MSAEVLRWRLLLTASKPLKSISKPYTVPVEGCAMQALSQFVFAGEGEGVRVRGEMN
jgi:hypothetical protein